MSYEAYRFVINFIDHGYFTSTDGDYYLLQPPIAAPIPNQSAVLPNDPPPAYQPSAAQQVDTTELQRRQEVRIIYIY